MTDRVTMILRGRMLEKFVGKAVGQGAAFQRIERTGPREMRIEASERDAGTIRALAEEYGLEWSVAGEAGRPYWKKRLRERGGMTLGLMLGVALVCLFSSRIWRVQAVSLDGMAGEELLAAIEESASEWGAGPGTVRSLVDRDGLAIQIQAQWPELTHVSVRLSGVFLRVEVAMEAAAPEIYDVSAGRDLVAARDAVIVYVEPLAGKANVEAGDTVRRGQVLIRGEERIDADVTRGIRALGSVLGRVWFTGECSLPLTETSSVRTGAYRASSVLKLGKWTWPLSQAEDFSSQETQEELLPVGGLYLPARIVRTTRWETVETTIPLDAETMRAQGEAWALELARAKLPADARETDYWIEYTEKDGMLMVQATLEAEMDIAAARAELTE